MYACRPGLRSHELAADVGAASRRHLRHIAGGMDRDLVMSAPDAVD
ncbi:hypothetical protein [Corynebacterium nuruki]